MNAHPKASECNGIKRAFPMLQSVCLRLVLSRHVSSGCGESIGEIDDTFACMYLCIASVPQPCYVQTLNSNVWQGLVKIVLVALSQLSLKACVDFLRSKNGSSTLVLHPEKVWSPSIGQRYSLFWLNF